MATANNYNVIGIKEDLENKIYTVYADDVPFTSMAGKAKVTQQYHEWQLAGVEALNPTNALIDGATFTNDSPRLTTRVGNRTQIFYKVGEVTGTMNATDAAGRSNELNYQKIKAGEGLVRDIEYRLSGNYASATGDGTANARMSGGFEAFLTTSAVRGAGGANGGFSGGNVAAASNANAASTVVFTEAMFQSAALQARTAGGKPSFALMGAALKQKFSSFSGVALNRIDNSNSKNGGITIMGAAEVYVSDFGKFSLNPSFLSGHSNNRSCLLIDPAYVQIGTLRPMTTEPLAKVADSERFAMVAEKTVIVGNEAAHGLVADIKAS